MSSRYLRAGVLILLLALVAGAGLQLRAGQPMHQAGVAGEIPRMVAPNGDLSGGKPEGAVTSTSAQPPRAGRSERYALSPALRDIRPSPPDPRQRRTVLELEVPQQGTQSLPPPASDPVAQTQAGAGELAMPSADAVWNGIGFTGWAPPDTNGDVGLGHYVQTVNVAFAIWEKNGTGARVYGPSNINVLWQGFGGRCEERNDGDPIVLYDELAGRWLISQFTTAAPFYQCVAVSSSPDPLDAWHLYAFHLSDTMLYDYPKFGVWPDGYYMAANRFESTPSGWQWRGPSAIVFDRATMIEPPASAQIAYKEYFPSFGHSFLPADLDGSAPPPTGAPNYFASLAGDGLDIWAYDVDWDSTDGVDGTSLTFITKLPVAPYTRLCASTGACVPQRNVGQRLDALSDRLMHRLAYRNFGSHEAMVVNHSVDAGGGPGGVRWYEVRRDLTGSGAPLTLHQQGTYAPDSHYRWMGSAALDSQGNMAVGYSVSSRNLYPSIRYAGRLAGDPLGQLAQGEKTLYGGRGSQSGVSRWGDYSAMSVDPVDGCTFWFTTEYNESFDWGWGTKIGTFRFPGCSGPEPTPTATPTVAPTSTPVAGTVHTGDLDGTAVNQGSRWQARVTIAVHDSSHNPVSGATVNGTWSGGYSGPASCVTGADGNCMVDSGSVRKNVGSISFTVDSLIGSLPYEAGNNHDPDGDSNGTSITVAKP